MPPAARPQTEDADRFLISRIRSGDPLAWKQLIDRYQGRLAAFARARMRGAAEVDDIIQDTFLGFLTSLRHFDESRSLETYLFAILRYKVGEYFTRRNRAPQAAPGFDIDDDAPAPPEPCTTETPSRVAARRELSRRQEQMLATMLRRLIDELRRRDRLDDIQAIELLFYVGARNKDVARRLNRDEKAIAGVKFRALARLREILDEMRAVPGVSLGPDDVPLDDDAVLARVWRQQRLTCLKRSTIGAYLLGVLDEPWNGFTRFHLDTVGCLMCRANRDDLAAPVAEAARAGNVEQIFQSSVGFLSHVDPSAAPPA